MCFFFIYFELTNPVVQNICDKNTLGDIMFYKHLLLCWIYHINTQTNACR